MRVAHARLILPALGFVVLVATVSAQSFDLKLGQWEYTISGIQIPADMLAKMPAAARARAEQMMKQGQTSRSCLTAADLKELNLAGTDDDDCKVTSRKVTATAADITVKCGGDEPRTQTMHYEALSRESVRGTITRTGGSGPTDITMAGKWIGAQCKED
jgi:hypothetical protein